MITLLTTPAKQHKIKRYFLEKLCSSVNIDYREDYEMKLTVQCLAHYLRSLRLNNCDLSNENLSRLCMLYKIESFKDDSEFLKKLCQFLQELFANAKELFSNDGILPDNQQYLVTLNLAQEEANITQLDHDFDMKVCCVLLNIFNNRLPSFYQILWCSSATEDDIQLFFSRVRTFHNLTFAVLDIDKMHHRLREQLLDQQSSLMQHQEHHGSVYYFTQEITACQKELRSFPMTQQYQDPKKTYTQLAKLFKNDNNKQPDIQIICGKPGVGKSICIQFLSSINILFFSSGKTHRIRNHYKDDNTLCFSVNDKLNLNLLTSSLLSYGSMASNTNPSIYFNISIHAPFEDLTRTLFSLLICGSLVDPHSGLTFSLLPTKSWKFIFEIPYTNKCQISTQENLAKILPILSLMAPSTIEEVTDSNYQLYIGEEEELVARFLKAYANQSIDRILTYDINDTEHPVYFDQLDDKNECRMHINDCFANYAPELSKDKVSQLSFIKFLYRRFRFFTSLFYQMNDYNKSLGSSVMKQMITEAKSLAQIDFQTSNYPRIFLVYDQCFALHLLHDGWDKVLPELRQIFKNSDPLCSAEFKDKDCYIKSLSWLIDIKYNEFEQIMRETKFILTENFAYKLFHVHERKLTKLPLIIEGETGVGKTFLLKFYSLLLNSKVTNGPFENNIAPRILERTSLWLSTTVLNEILERESHILKEFLKKIKPKLVQCGKINANDDNDDVDDDEQETAPNNPLHNTYSLNTADDAPMSMIQDDDENLENDQHIEQNLTTQDSNVKQLPTTAAFDENLLKKIKRSLQNFEYDKNILRFIWKTILTVSSQNATNVTQKLIQQFYEYITSNLRLFPLIETSFRLKELLKKTSSPSEETAIEIFNEYLFFTQTKPLFYRLLLHPGITEKQLEQFLLPISQFASQLPNIELVVFFDEINTSSCLGLFTEIFINRTLYGVNLSKNIFFTGAINPAVQVEHDIHQVHRTDYLVHQLPEALDHLKVSYGILESEILKDYITKKIATFLIDSGTNNGKKIPLDKYAQDVLSSSILKAQEFCEKRLGNFCFFV
jgi:Cdc6-like AAA superfamily ATPase